MALQPLPTRALAIYSASPFRLTQCLFIERIIMTTGVHGSFLIRASESKPGDYSLSTREGDAVKHYRIRKLDAGGERPMALMQISPCRIALLSATCDRVTGLAKLVAIVSWDFLKLVTYVHHLSSLSLARLLQAITSRQGWRLPTCTTWSPTTACRPTGYVTYCASRANRWSSQCSMTCLGRQRTT